MLANENSERGNCISFNSYTITLFFSVFLFILMQKARLDDLSLLEGSSPPNAKKFYEIRDINYPRIYAGLVAF